jgi:hypothetical protein
LASFKKLQYVFLRTAGIERVWYTIRFSIYLTASFWKILKRVNISEVYSGEGIPQVERVPKVTNRILARLASRNLPS